MSADRLFARAIFACALAGTVAAGQAGAQHVDLDRLGGPATWQAGGLYIAPGGRAEFIFVPRTTTSFTPDFLANSPAMEFAATRNATAGGAATVGLVLPASAVPAWLALPRIELFGHFTSGRSEQEQAFALAPISAYHSAVGLDLFALGATQAYQRVKVSDDAFRVGLRLAADVPLVAGVVITPEFSFFGGRQSTTYDFLTALQFPGNAAQIARTGRLPVTQYGGTVGATLAFRPLPWLAAHGRGVVGMLRNSAELSTAENIVQTIGPTFAFQANTERSATGFIGSFEIGATASIFSNIDVSLTGGFDYIDRNTTPRFPATTGATPRIDFSSAFNYHFTARVVVRIF
jgi:hypothetical protein